MNTAARNHWNIMTLSVLIAWLGLIGCVSGSSNAMTASVLRGGSSPASTSTASNRRQLNPETNVPLIVQSSAPASQPSSSQESIATAPSAPSTSSNQQLGTFLTQPADIIKQDYRQILQVSQSQEFSDEDIVTFQLLLTSYTANFGSNAGSPEIVSACEVTAQDLISLYGRNNTSKNLLTLSFTMGYDSRYGYDVGNYPTLFHKYVNSNLESVTADMQDRFLPVAQVKEVETMGTLIAPTDSPSQDPALKPTSLSPTKVPSTSPSKSPTLMPTYLPTHTPSQSPTSTPSQSPSKAPTSAPTTVAPTTPSPTNNPTTPSPTNGPTLSKRTFEVQSSMVLYNGDAMLNDDGTLIEEAKEEWIHVTRGWILDATWDIIRDSSDGGLVVIVSLNSHEVIAESRRQRMLMINLRRKLQQQQSPLQLNFTTSIEFDSEQEEWDANEMVASRFRSAEQQNGYVDALKGIDGLERMTMKVDGEEVVTSETPKTIDSAELDNDENHNESNINNTFIFAMVMTVLAMCILLLMGLCYGRKNRRESSKDEKHQPSDDVLNEGSVKGSDNTSNCNEEEGEEENDEEDDTVFHSVTAVAPIGKLGLVIANPNKDIPVVFSIKEGSVLQGRVMVGDLLLSVDEIDCQAMSALEVSNLISQRSNNPARTLVMLREQ